MTFPLDYEKCDRAPRGTVTISRDVGSAAVGIDISPAADCHRSIIMSIIMIGGGVLLLIAAIGQIL